MRSLLLASATIAALCAAVPARAVDSVDLKLVIATDVSRSVDDDEARLQREGTAAAFMSPDVVKAIQGGSLGRIAVVYIDFSSPYLNQVVVDWRIIKDKASATAFAQAVAAAPRTDGMRTSISSAVEMGEMLLMTSEREIISNRRVIDISGDGPNNDGTPMNDAHDEAVAKGIVINGLPVMDDSDGGHNYTPGLDKYYSSCVIGGKGSFMIVAKNFKDFGQAIRRKLILEISQRAPAGEPRIIPAAATTRLAQDALPANPLKPQAPKPVCDIYGGGGGFGGFGGYGRF